MPLRKHPTYGPVRGIQGRVKPDLRDRAGIASYERLADLLDGHDEGDLASWVRARLAVASISTAAFASVKGRPSEVR
jgi:hypothetical protein